MAPKPLINHLSTRNPEIKAYPFGALTKRGPKNEEPKGHRSVLGK